MVCPFAEMTLQSFNDVMETNLAAPYFLTQILLKELQARAATREQARAVGGRPVDGARVSLRMCAQLHVSCGGAGARARARACPPRLSRGRC